jgi:hypothetical protein
MRTPFNFSVRELAAIEEQIQKEGWHGSLQDFLDAAERIGITPQEIRDRLVKTTEGLSLTAPVSDRRDGAVVVSDAFSL